MWSAIHGQEQHEAAPTGPSTDQSQAHLSSVRQTLLVGTGPESAHPNASSRPGCRLLSRGSSGNFVDQREEHQQLFEEDTEHRAYLKDADIHTQNTHPYMNGEFPLKPSKARYSSVPICDSFPRSFRPPSTTQGRSGGAAAQGGLEKSVVVFVLVSCFRPSLGGFSW